MYDFCFDCYVVVVKGSKKDHNSQRKAGVRNLKQWVGCGVTLGILNLWVSEYKPTLAMYQSNLVLE